MKLAGLLFALVVVGCRAAETEKPPAQPKPQQSVPDIPDPCLALQKQLAELDGRIRSADCEITATAAEADLAKYEFERAARYGGSEGAQRAAPAYRRATQVAADALRTKASLLDQRDVLRQNLQSNGCK